MRSPRNPARRALILVAGVFAFFLNAIAQTQTADTVVLNGRIYTVNSLKPWAEAVAIRDGKILAVGTAKEIASYRSASTKVIDAQRHLVLPGFTDSHIHFLDGSLGLLRVRLEDANSIAEIQARVKDFAAKHPDAKWILGRGWSYPVFAPAGLPDKKILDEVLPDRPVYLEAFDGHTYWANSKALELAGITKETPDPLNGTIVRDPTTKEATGALQEDAADALMEPAIPPPSREEKLRAFRAGMHEANRVGLVRVHSASGETPANDDFGNADLLDELRKSGELTVRFYLARRAVPPEFGAEQIEEVEAARRKYHDDWISAGAVKFFLDGVVEGHTAAMLSPYSDDPKLSGSLFWDPAKYKQLVAELDKRGMQIFTHAIGDKAVRLALDAYAEAADRNHTHDSRHRIEHIETIAADDIPRFGKLGVIASMQPLHAYPDDNTLKIWARNAGPEREQRGFAWRSIEKSGGVLAFGSDWPVVTLNPWSGIQNAVTRQTTEGTPSGSWLPKERISLESAIKGYTLGAAIGGHREKTEGSLEVGKVADLIVVSQDLFKIKPSQIAKTEVLLTMVGGKVGCKSSAWKEPAAAGGEQ